MFTTAAISGFLVKTVVFSMAAGETIVHFVGDGLEVIAPNAKQFVVDKATTYMEKSIEVVELTAEGISNHFNK